MTEKAWCALQQWILALGAKSRQLAPLGSSVQTQTSWKITAEVLLCLGGSRKSTEKCSCAGGKPQETTKDVVPFPQAMFPVGSREGTAGTATALCYLRISTAKGKPQARGWASPPPALRSRDGINEPVGAWRLRTESQISRGVRAWCWGRGKKLKNAPSYSRQPALSIWPN